MSTKNVQTTQGTFDPTSMSTFNALQGGYRQNMQDFMNNPLQSSFFNTQMQMANAQNRYAFGGANRTMGQNMAAGGFVGNAPAYMQSNLLRNQRGLSSANANSFNNLLLGANQLRFGATQGAGAYRPFQTGQTQTQTQSGLGSWLPQVIGAGLGAAGGGMFSQIGKSISPFMQMGQSMGSMMAKGFSGAPQSVDQSMMPADNTLIGPSY
jgi:hypothetical protein